LSDLSLLEVLGGSSVVKAGFLVLPANVDVKPFPVVGPTDMADGSFADCGMFDPLNAPEYGPVCCPC
jgi:hypothetical protein